MGPIGESGLTHGSSENLFPIMQKLEIDPRTTFQSAIGMEGY